MKFKLLVFLALVLSAISFGQSFSPPSRRGAGVDNALTRRITVALKECQTLKPGMTRSELLKVFTTEGGLSTALHRTFVYRGCPYIKVDVDFRLSDSGQNVLVEKPTDIIVKISKPYLEWGIID